jgi:hypothetical protein
VDSCIRKNSNKKSSENYLKLSIPCIFRTVDRNYICNMRTKYIYTVKYMCYYQGCPTYFGTYCAIFRENFIVCSELLLVGFEHTINFFS